MTANLILVPVPADPVPVVARKADVLRRLDFTIRRRLDGAVAGEFLASRPGPGSEPAGAREFTVGDDSRRIDWNLTARSLTPHVRITDADRELITWVLADRSASLDFGTARSEKRELVLAATAAVGMLTERSGNRLGVAVTGGQTLERFEAAATHRGVMVILSRLYDIRFGGEPATEASLSGGLGSIERTHRRRGQVVVISDFLDGDWVAPMRQLSLRHQVLAIQIIDPRELELPAVGMLSVVDTETGRRLDVQTNKTELRARYAERAAERHAAIAENIRAAGADHLVLSTEDDWVGRIISFVSTHRNVRRAAHRKVIR